MGNKWGFWLPLQRAGSFCTKNKVRSSGWQSFYPGTDGIWVRNTVEDLESAFKAMPFHLRVRTTRFICISQIQVKGNILRFCNKILQSDQQLWIRAFRCRNSDILRRLDLQKSAKNLSYKELLQTGDVFSQYFQCQNPPITLKKKSDLSIHTLSGRIKSQLKLLSLGNYHLLFFPISQLN